MKVYKPDEDKLYLITITSSWDYLNEEKNSARLELFRYQSSCESRKIKCRTVQLESSNIGADFVTQLKEREVDEFYIGATAYCYSVDPDNFLFTAFSALKRFVFGTVGSYVQANATCKVHVIP